MPKPKLSDAVKSAATTAKTQPAAAGGDAGKSVTPPAGDGGTASAEGEDDADDDGEPDDSAGDNTPAEPPAKPAAAQDPAPPVNGQKSLADFRSAFGHVEGSIYFAESLTFSDACVKHVAVLGEQIAAKDQTIAKLTADNQTLADQLKGEAEPIVTNDQKTEASGPDDAVSDFASAIEAKAAKKATAASK